ncbi:MAG: hypothetical protein K0U98_15385 [Deltaproteobacteria bacterium]|nr:hypothetical protein [Deltaproteobacteria bacterium]
MPITTKDPAPPSAMQRFRSTTEGYLMQVAQREMVRLYPSAGHPPAPKSGFIYRLLPILFLPGFRLTPWFIKRRLLPLFFVHREQQWPDKPWKKDQPGRQE